MGCKRALYIAALFTTFDLFNSFSYAFDTINQAQFLSDSANESLVSSDGNFRLGFFCPGNSQFRYVGIWFNKVSIQTVVWVANRESPIKNSEGIFKVGEDGNLGIFDGNESSPLWSTNVSIPKKPSRAKLLDSGNLVLVTERGESDTGTILWQSFDYPTDTLLPGMKFGFNRKTGKTHVLTSWKSIDDPAPGEFSGKYDHRGSPQFFLCKSSVPYYRCGPWNGRRLNGLPDAITKHQMSQKVQYSNQIDLMNYTFVNDENIDVYSGFPSIVGTFTRIVLEPLGTLQRQFWHENRTWMKFWVGSQDFCDGYSRCGVNAICNLDTMVFCLCLPGFEPLHPQDWNLNCVETRKVDGCGKGFGEGFVRLKGVKWPDARNSTVYGNMTLKECERECLKSCNCTGYASSNVDESEQGCIIWYGGLKDMRQYKDEQHFYLRVDAIELAASARKNSKQFLAANSTLAFIVMPISVEVLVIAAFCYCWKRRAKSKDRKEKQSRGGSSLFDSATSLSNHEDFPYSKSSSEGGNPELTLFKLSTLMAATDNFSSANKLGRGGFGPVYKVLKDGEVIVSRGKIFALGFFSPGNSVKRYVGIWYNEISEQTVVWVANRDNPIKDTSGVLSVSSQGNLVLYKSNQTVPVWHANVSDTSADNSVVQLLDSGNLVLVRNDTGEILWQSFDRPTDTMLPHMKIGLDKRTGLNRILTSWKSWDDPGTGNSSFRMELAGFPQLFLYNCGAKWWRVGSWTGQKWSGFPGMKKGYILNYIFIDNDDEVSIAYGVIDPAMLTRIIVNDSGNEQRLTWSKQEHRWIGYFSYPKEPCDYYGHCGPNSNCNPYLWDENECTCLPGFEPKSPADWYLRDGSGGCVRKPQMPTCQRGDGFIRVSRTKVPDTSVANVNMSLGMKECKDVCLRDCSCLAYTSAHADSNEGLGCLTYHGDMVDTRTYINAGQDLFVRVDAVELALQMKNSSLAKKKIEAIVILSFIAMLLMVVVVCYSFKKKRLMENASSCRLSGFSFRFTFSQRLSYLEDSIRSENQEDGSRRNSEYLPVFDLSTIAVATNDFSSDNKLGEGGFGSVYKGVLDNGNEIAVKRLSRSSGQGIEEFKTEVALIAQLQHRNLVSILGCCIEAQEKMLIYEYLPNKSLDVSIFDETKRSLLGWNKRFEIIRGIARGILYLHQDSRLRIIHRDLKASNVLLDAAMNPKISDFGMARIFGGDQIEGNTNRVVGTYGYMAPEYAMEGLFSTKSDVYSFGVLLLEIISGRKNSAYYLEEGCGSSNLVGHIWDLWNDGRTMEIVDKSMGDSCPAPEILRCIHIGLLCVQEQAMDRPTMSTVVFMLGNDNAPPSPKHPAFIAKGVSNVEDFWTNEGVSASVNEMTITEFQAR